MAKPRDERDYLMYRDDDFVDIGKLREIAQRQCLELKTLFAYKRKTKMNKNKRGIVIMLVDENE